MTSRVSELQLLQQWQIDDDEVKRLEDVHTACHDSLHGNRRHDMCHICREYAYYDYYDGLDDLLTEQLEQAEDVWDRTVKIEP